ncbi:MAG: type IIL restriction-modification enzyme MmeI, partial [Planctomycetota bacterium]
MNPSQFVAKWRKVELTERSASHEHFLDLCDLLDHPRPADVDPTGESFTFEKGASKHAGGDGWADVWKKGFFAIEYKGRHKDLDAAYDQLLQYREALENPPLLVTCDMDRIVIRTNFTATPTQLYDISLDRLAEPRSLEILRASFYDPAKLKPGATSEAITAHAATHLAEIAEKLRARGADPLHVAHFLDRIVFCLFAEDIGLLPEDLFTRIVEKSRDDPARFSKLLSQLFDAMAHGGDFGADTIRHFNGNLFVEGPVLDLTHEEIDKIAAASRLDWSAVDPSIFGTLFERGMDPAKRSQLGAHYTSRADIETLVEPVVMSPLRREWEATKALVENLLSTGKKHPPASSPFAPFAPLRDASASPPQSVPQSRDPERSRGAKSVDESLSPPRLSPAALRKAVNESGILIHAFLVRLSKVKVLDPACGSGNFLYVTLQKLKDLEKEVITYAGDRIGRSYL